MLCLIYDHVLILYRHMWWYLSQVQEQIRRKLSSQLLCSQSVCKKGLSDFFVWMICIWLLGHSLLHICCKVLNNGFVSELWIRNCVEGRAHILTGGTILVFAWGEGDGRTSQKPLVRIASLIVPMHATCTVHLILVAFISLIMFGKEYKLPGSIMLSLPSPQDPQSVFFVWVETHRD